MTIGTEFCPKNYWQYYAWCYKFLPGDEIFYTVGLAAVIWVIWLARNRATFEFNMIKSPFEIVFFCCFAASVLGRSAEGKRCKTTER